MARLPTPGSDSGTWGALLNDFLDQVHASDGQLKGDVVGSSQIQDGAVGSDHIQAGAVTSSQLASNAVDNTTIADGSITQVKLDASVQAKLNASGVTSVNTRSGAVTLSKTDVDLANVDNTSDLSKPISAATQTALDAKADATDIGAKVLLINTSADLPEGTPAGVIVVVKN